MEQLKQWLNESATHIKTIDELVVYNQVMTDNILYFTSLVGACYQEPEQIFITKHLKNVPTFLASPAGISAMEDLYLAFQIFTESLEKEAPPQD